MGQIPNIDQAVVIGVPHTSNLDGVYALPLLVELGVDIKILAKKRAVRRANPIPVLDVGRCHANRPRQERFGASGEY